MSLQLKDPTLLCEKARIGASWIGVQGDQKHEVFNPATGERVGVVPKLGKAQAKQAIDAAHQALPAWRALAARDRSRLLKRWYDLIIENSDDLARLMTAEQGKSLAEAAGEVTYGASFIEWFAEEGKRTYGDVIPSPETDKRIIVIKQPIGVCAAITPWNFPNAMITRKAAPALACGCTMVLRPSEKTPFSALALAVLAERAGIPPGVFNVITGGSREIGGELCESPLVRKLSFTGSTAVGIELMAQCAPTLKKLSLELGGNAPFIVFDDADLDAAVDGAIAAKYRNSGQTCVCANRIYVQAGIYNAFATRMAQKAKTLKVGNGAEPGVVQGPLIDEKALEKVEDLVQDACTKGAKILAGGQRHPLGGTFYEPTVLGDATADMRIAREEVFGPVAPLFRFDDENQAVALANDTEFGLAAYVYGRDYARLCRVSEALEYGMVAINSGSLSTEVAPFGGVKASGLGREGSHYGIDEYLEIKYISVGGVTQQR